MTKATTEWRCGTITVELDHDNDDIEMLVEQFRATLLAVGYQPETVKGYLG